MRSILTFIVGFTAFTLLATAKSDFTDEDLGFQNRAGVIKLLGYPAKIALDDPTLNGGIGATSVWTYYFESRDHQIIQLRFWFDRDKHLCHTALSQGSISKEPFHLLRVDDPKDIQKILRSERPTQK